MRRGTLLLLGLGLLALLVLGFATGAVERPKWLGGEGARDVSDGGDREDGVERATDGAPTLVGRAPDAAASVDAGDLPLPVDLDAVDRDRDLHGVVVEADGTPIAGAHLQTVTYPWRWIGVGRRALRDEETPGPATRSARDGTFVLRLRPGARVNLRVDAVGFALLELHALNAGERVRVVLTPGVSLIARVLGADGVPVEGARVRLLGRDWGPKAKEIELHRLARSGKRGTARLDRLPGGRSVTLTAEHDLLGSAERVVLELPAEGTIERTLTFAPGRGLTGRITDAASGEPLEGAQVAWGTDPARGVLADAEGRYVLPPRSGWRNRLTARADGYQLGVLSVGAVDTLDIPLHAGATVVGCVVSARGEPVAGAQIAGATKVDGSTVRTPVSTVECSAGPDGCFRLPVVRTDAALRLVVWAAGHGRLTKKIAAERLSPGEVDLGDVVLPESRAVAGVVVEAGGEAVPRVRVTIGRLTRTPLYDFESEYYAYGTQDECWTDDLGRFRFVDLMPGAFRLRVEPREQDPFSKDVRVLEDEDLEDVQLILPQTRPLRVTVETGEGAPIPDVKVHVWGAPGRRARTLDTDAQGVALLRLTGPARSVTLQLPAALRGTYVGALSRQLDVADRAVDFVLHEGLETRGRIVDQHGQPGGGLYVYVHIDGEEADTRVAAADGTFVVTVPTGRPTDLVVTGWANVPLDGGGTQGAHLPVAGRLDSVKAGAQDLVLPVTRDEADRTPRTRVVLPSGEPAPQALVMYQPGPNGGFGHVQTDEEGRAEITGLAPVPMKLTARYWSQDLPNVGAYAEGVVPAGQEVVLRIETGHELTGRVLDTADQPLFQIEVHVKCGSGTTHMTKSGPDGSFRFALAPRDGERVTVEAAHTTEDGRHLSGTLKDVPSDSRDLRLVLEPPRQR